MRYVVLLPAATTSPGGDNGDSVPQVLSHPQELPFTWFSVEFIRKSSDYLLAGAGAFIQN